MGTLLSMILPAFAAPIADGIKALIRKKAGVSVDDEIKLLNANTEKLRVVAELDRPTEKISGWVADLRASFRYICAGVIILAAIALSVYVVVVSPEMRPVIAGAFLELTGAAFSFIFGERMYLGLTGKK